MNSEILNLINKFLNSWYFVILFIGTVFIIFTKKAWNRVIENLRLNFKHKGIKISSEETQQGQKEKIPKKDLKEIESFLSEIGIKDSKKFNQFIEGISSDLDFKNQTIKEKERAIEKYKDLVVNLFDAFEFYQFSYLNLYLVYNSKLALWWFYTKGPTTKNLFILTFPLHPSILNPTSEKETIFNVLLVNRLIEARGDGLYKVSIIGERFLRFIGFIK